MSSPSRGKLVKADYGRPHQWAAYPDDLCRLYSPMESTSVVCEDCRHPCGGLRFDAERGVFVHRELKDCTPRFASRR